MINYAIEIEQTGPLTSEQAVKVRISNSNKNEATPMELQAGMRLELALAVFVEVISSPGGRRVDRKTFEMAMRKRMQGGMEGN